MRGLLSRLTTPGALRGVSAGRRASTKAPPKTTADDDDGSGGRGDFRPPWVYSGSRFLIYTTIPVALLYCSLLADWGEREHIFMPLRRWVSGHVQSVLSLSPEETALVRGRAEPVVEREKNSTRNDAARITDEISSAASTKWLPTLVRYAFHVSLREPCRWIAKTEAEIYAIKRQYLGLLSPQQIIDICLTFEAHAPLHVKSTVWPYDIRAAIASIQAHKPTTESDVPSKTSAPDTALTTQPRPSSSQQSTPTPSQPAASSQPSASQPSTPGPHYPHHPYFHPTYPHAPYYTSPHVAYGYPYPPPPAMYPVNAPNHHPPLFTNAPLAHPSHPAPEQPTPHSGTDDLPSYEEMIVEALLDSGDPEGCAPKSLFTWMAMHYPLQMNFRPSASQALQKAYKRGRLEKGSNGKYRLNESWEGGNTSKRTTRRPQTLAQTGLTGPQPSSSSPFTHAPLGPHGTLQARPPPQPPGYGAHPFVYPHQGTSGSAHGARGAVSLKHVDHETGEGSDAWEAAQNILKAINFGQLFQMPNEDVMTGEPSTSGTPPPHPHADGPDESASASVTVAPGAMIVEERVGTSTELNAEQRAALQAQLALLAAQLAEIADVTEDELSQNLEVSSRTVARSPQVSGEGSSGPAGDGDGHEDNEDMVEVPVPMGSLTA